jgi:hypothetical protein
MNKPDVSLSYSKERAENLRDALICILPTCIDTPTPQKTCLKDLPSEYQFELLSLVRKLHFGIALMDQNDESASKTASSSIASATCPEVI